MTPGVLRQRVLPSETHHERADPPGSRRTLTGLRTSRRTRGADGPTHDLRRRASDQTLPQAKSLPRVPEEEYDVCGDFVGTPRDVDLQELVGGTALESDEVDGIVTVVVDTLGRTFESENQRNSSSGARIAETASASPAPNRLVKPPAREAIPRREDADSSSEPRPTALPSTEGASVPAVTLQDTNAVSAQARIRDLMS